jgi:hypothetical protein
MPAGYSGTPLAKKLGIKAGSRLWLLDAPTNYDELVAPLPSGVRRQRRMDADTDLVHIFCTRRTALVDTLLAARARLRPDASIWVSWPKKSSKVPTDVTEDVIREVALPMGFVDIKVCAVDEVWSGLKLVVRKELRKVARQAGA